jgi:hypothetical protein
LDRSAAGGAAGETAIDPIVIGVVGNDEDAPLGLRRHAGAKEGRKGNAGNGNAHRIARWFEPWIAMLKMHEKALRWC